MNGWEKKQDPGPAAVIITGASDGLGAALARHLACPGRHLALNGRNPDRLEMVATFCRQQGATVDAAICDVTDAGRLAEWLLAVDDRRPTDWLIANAGISAGTGQAGESAAQVHAIFATNLIGVCNTVLPVLPRLRRRRRGQIGLMASLASFHGFPGAPAYCASKAAVRVWGEGLRGELAPEGVGVSVICPGFVRTAMTAVNRFPMPFLLEPEPAARRIVQGLAANRARIAFPLPMRLATWILAALPAAWSTALTRTTPRK